MSTKKDDIKQHMEVIGSDGQHVGKVDRVEMNDQIKLTKDDPQAGGEHHVIPLSLVDHVDEHVHLNKPANDVKSVWKAVA